MNNNSHWSYAPKLPWSRRFRFLLEWLRTYLPRRCDCYNCRERCWNIFRTGY